MDTDDKLERPVEHSRHLAIMRTRLLIALFRIYVDESNLTTPHFGTR